MKVSDVVAWFESWAPTRWAEDWDRVGLQIGSPEASCKKILCSLDLDERACKVALDGGFDLVLVHHPPLFHPLKALRTDLPESGRILRLAAAGVSVYAAHTNLDVAPGGVNDVLIERLGLQPESILLPREESLVKLVTFIPSGYEDTVREAISAAGAGWIGQYSDCTFQSEGEGTFRPRSGTNPFIGTEGRLERVRERRLETVLPESRIPKVLQALRESHPYEEVAYDLYPLHASQNIASPIGLGRVGRLPEPIRLDEAVQWVQESLGVSSVRWFGDFEKRVQTVGVLGGAGGSLIERLHRGPHIDLLITGDVSYHQGLLALDHGLAVVDAGHDVTEWPMMDALARRLSTWLLTQNEDVQVEALPPTTLWRIGEVDMHLHKRMARIEEDNESHRASGTKVDEAHSKDSSKHAQATKAEMRRLVLHTDGGSRGNPGPAGIGVVISDVEGAIVEEIARPIGIATNNIAEYKALIEALKRADELGARDVQVYADSQLMIQQMNGTYKVKNEGLRPLYEEALRLSRGFDRVTFTHVPRERNKEADRLVNQGIDAACE